MYTVQNSVDSDMRFSDYHITTAKAINKEIAEKNLKKLGKITCCIPKADYWFVIYAYYNLFGISFNAKIQSLINDPKDLMKYGLL